MQQYMPNVMKILWHIFLNNNRMEPDRNFEIVGYIETMENKNKIPKLHIVFVLLLLLLNFPLLSVVINGPLICGVPCKVVYVFGVWLVAILAAAFIINKNK
jgi:hypothetical protein